jgi:sec-independent protein translocase protein TatA
MAAGSVIALFGFLDFLGPSGIIIVAVIAVLLYGERLPEVARTFGKNFLELKKSIQGVRQELEAAARDVTTSVRQSIENPEPADREEATAPKFEPPPSQSAEDPEGAPPMAPKFEPPPRPSAEDPEGARPAAAETHAVLGTDAVPETHAMPEIH